MEPPSNFVPVLRALPLFTTSTSIGSKDPVGVVLEDVSSRLQPSLDDLSQVDVPVLVLRRRNLQVLLEDRRGHSDLQLVLSLPSNKLFVT